MCKFLKKLFSSKKKENLEFIFDTNGYRTCVYGRSLAEAVKLGDDFSKCEEIKGDHSSMSIVVMMELIQHLTDEDPAKEECFKALCMAFFHTSRYNEMEKTRGGSYYPPMNVILARVFFNDNSKYIELYNKVVGLFIELGKDADISKCKQYESEIRAVKAQIIFEKEEMRTNVENFLASLNEGTVDWQYFGKNKTERERFFKKLRNGDMTLLLGKALMARAHQVMDTNSLISNADEKLEEFITNYRAAILMNLNLLEAIGHGVEKLKDSADPRWNTLNDVQIMFALLFMRTAKEHKVLITQEKKIKESAAKAGVGEKVATIDEYKKMISYGNN